MTEGVPMSQTASPTENDMRAAMAVGKKLIVLAEADDYELCVPEDGFRPKDSFWRRKETSSLVAIVRMTSSASSTSLASSTSSASPISSTSPQSEPTPIEAASSEPAIEFEEPVKLRLVRDKFEVPNKLERGEKICVDCGLPYPLAAFYTSSSSKDGRQSRCKECDNKRRAEHNQGLHVRASAQNDFVRETSRKRAAEVAAAAGKAAPYTYKGATGGFLIFGYVK
jgi:hypothetical protein